ncbi:hypothetical protein GOP47_0027526 [Adiantum capillus-veneris]|nr:hypothetical protein GOP47_0027526 [Adiantum capillus-veneris]
MDDALPTFSVESMQTDILNALDSISAYSPSNQLSESPPGEKVTPPTWNMFDFFVKSFLQFIMNLGGDLSPDLLKFHQYFQKFRDIAFTRFYTSSEEKGTIDSYRNKIFQREEKAIKDLAALEQQLQFEREERAKAFSRYQIAENHLHQEEELVKEEALEVEQNLEVEFNAIEEQEMKTFQAEESNFNAKRTELMTLLNQLQVENRENELSLRGKKEQSADEVRNLLDEYNQDLQMRKEDLQKLREDHESIRSKLDVYQIYFRNKELEEARKQEQERLKNEAILSQVLSRGAGIAWPAVSSHTVALQAAVPSKPGRASRRIRARCSLEAGIAWPAVLSHTVALQAAVPRCSKTPSATAANLVELQGVGACTSSFVGQSAFRATPACIQQHGALYWLFLFVITFLCMGDLWWPSLMLHQDGHGIGVHTQHNGSPLRFAVAET